MLLTKEEVLIPIDLKNYYVIELDTEKDCEDKSAWHIQLLSEAIASNINSGAKNPMFRPKWSILGITRTCEDAHKFADSMLMYYKNKKG
jgi:hypothetical protein